MRNRPLNYNQRVRLATIFKLDTIPDQAFLCGRNRIIARLPNQDTIEYFPYEEDIRFILHSKTTSSPITNIVI